MNIVLPYLFVWFAPRACCLRAVIYARLNTRTGDKRNENPAAITGRLDPQTFLRRVNTTPHLSVTVLTLNLPPSSSSSSSSRCNADVSPFWREERKKVFPGGRKRCPEGTLHGHVIRTESFHPFNPLSNTYYSNILLLLKNNYTSIDILFFYQKILYGTECIIISTFVLRIIMIKIGCLTECEEQLPHHSGKNTMLSLHHIIMFFPSCE